MNHVEGMAINRRRLARSTPRPPSPARSTSCSREAATGALTQATRQRLHHRRSGGRLHARATSSPASTRFVVAPTGGNVYATSLTSNSVTMFRPTASGAGLAQPARPEGEKIRRKVPSARPQPDGCLVYLRSPGCSFGRAMKVPEGLDISPEGDQPLRRRLRDRCDRRPRPRCRNRRRHPEAG